MKCGGGGEGEGVKEKRKGEGKKEREQGEEEERERRGRGTGKIKESKAVSGGRSQDPDRLYTIVQEQWPQSHSLQSTPCLILA